MRRGPSRWISRLGSSNRIAVTNNLAVDPAVELIDLIATELAVALVLLLFNEIASSSCSDHSANTYPNYCNDSGSLVWDQLLETAREGTV